MPSDRALPAQVRRFAGGSRLSCRRASATLGPVTHESTAETCLERWWDDLPRRAINDYVHALGWTFGEVALAVGDVALARAWAQGFRVDSVFARATALSRLAEAARGRPELVSALLREGYACATHESQFVELLLVDDFADPAVAAVARERVYERLSELGGTADLAWYLVRARLPAAEEAAHLATLERVLPHRNEASRCAMAAALRIVHARRGDLAAAEAARQLIDLRRPLPLYASRAVIVCAAAAGELAAIAPELDYFVRRDVLVALVGGGDVEAALARWPGESVARDALFARLAPDHPRAAEWRARAEAGAAELDQQYAEGLITSFEVHEAHLELIALRGAHDPSRARAELLTLAASIAADHAAMLQNARQLLTDVEAGTRSLEPVIDEQWFTPHGERALARALDEWCAAPDMAARFRMGRRGARIFHAAAAFARRGDVARAEALMERAFVGEEALVSLIQAVQPGLVPAYLATDRIEVALALAQFEPMRPDALAPLLVELAEFGHLAEALALLEPALERASSAGDLVTLAPAVLAVADDRSAAAAEMLDALDRADAIRVHPAFTSFDAPFPA
jgi:hypothetical protein